MIADEVEFYINALGKISDLESFPLPLRRKRYCRIPYSLLLQGMRLMINRLSGDSSKRSERDHEHMWRDIDFEDIDSK